MPPERPHRPPTRQGPRRFAGDLEATQIVPSGGGRHARHARPDPPPSRPRRATTLGRTVVVLAACGVLTATGLTWSGAQTVQNAFHTSDALDGAPRSSGAAENILLIGLDSRKDRNGNDLPPDVLAQLHAGDGQEGGYNTNTLILIHVPADGKNITAFSIPRDDYVPVAGIDGYDHAKIKEAYGLKKPRPNNTSSTPVSPTRRRSNHVAATPDARRRCRPSAP